MCPTRSVHYCFQKLFFRQFYWLMQTWCTHLVKSLNIWKKVSVQEQIKMLFILSVILNLWLEKNASLVTQGNRFESFYRGTSVNPISIAVSEWMVIKSSDLKVSAKNSVYCEWNLQNIISVTGQLNSLLWT